MDIGSTHAFGIKVHSGGTYLNSFHAYDSSHLLAVSREVNKNETLSKKNSHVIKIKDWFTGMHVIRSVTRQADSKEDHTFPFHMRVI